jgi:hypothetical protein
VKKPSSGGVIETVSVFRAGALFYYKSTIRLADLPSLDYKFAHNLSTATITGAKPIHGTANYSGSKAAGNSSSGKLNGNLAVMFASIGAVNPFVHGALNATQTRHT